MNKLFKALDAVHAAGAVVCLVSSVFLVVTERAKQWLIYSPKSDDTHTEGELASAAACYAAPRKVYYRTRPNGPLKELWPWDAKEVGEHTRLQELALAGSLILAEMERIQRVAWLTSRDAPKRAEVSARRGPTKK